MKIQEAKVGVKVQTLTAFCDVPYGTTGLIDEDYDTGVMIRWDLPHNWKPLRDGFDKETELHHLEVLK